MTKILHVDSTSNIGWSELGNGLLFHYTALPTSKSSRKRNTVVIMRTKERKELSVFVIICFEVNLDVNSNKLKWSPVPYLRKLL